MATPIAVDKIEASVSNSIPSGNFTPSEVNIRMGGPFKALPGTLCSKMLL